MNVPLEELTAWLDRQRWYGNKGVPISRVEVLDRIQLPGSESVEAEASVVQVSYLLGTPERYLAFLERGADGQLRDALEDPAVARAVLAFAWRGGRVPVGTGDSVKAEVIGDGARVVDRLPKEPAVRALGVEQSNTSLVLGEKVLLKIFRKLEAGLNPELEMGRFLALHDFRATPKLLAALTLEGGTSSVVALAYAFVPNDGDGWEWALASLRDSPRPRPELLASLEQLGTTVGNLHRTLASDPDDPEFAPEQLQQADLQRWSSSIVGEMGVSLAKAAERFPALLDRQEALTERAKVLASVPPSGQKIRQHGDLHLGQALRVGQEWMIIDWEGEPARPLQARREKHTPLRDVAGMLRSFAYAAAVAGVPPEQRRATVEAMRAAFLRGWQRVVEGTGLAPASADDRDTLLGVLELEKTLYELRYELLMRPDWAHIPAEALG
jgi:maltokinase